MSTEHEWDHDVCARCGVRRRTAGPLELGDYVVEWRRPGDAVWSAGPMPQCKHVGADLDEDERVCAAATPGPWTTAPVSTRREALLRFAADDREMFRTRSIQLSEGDATFCARARTRYPALVAEVRRLRAALEWIAAHGSDIGACPALHAREALREEKTDG